MIAGLQARGFAGDWKESLRAADSLRARGEFNLASDFGMQALDQYQKIASGEDSIAAEILYRTGRSQYDGNRFVQAESSFRRSYTTWKNIFGERNLATAKAETALANVVWDLGRYHEAELLHVQAIETRRTLLGENTVGFAMSLANLASLCVDMGRYVEADQYHHEALKSFELANGLDDPVIRVLYNNMGGQYEAQGRLKDALDSYEHALEIYERVDGPNAFWTAMVLANLGKTHFSLKNYDQAKVYLGRAVGILSSAPNLVAAQTTDMMGDLFVSLGNLEEAEVSYKKAIETYKLLVGEKHPYTARSQNALADAMLKKGKFGEADSLYAISLATRLATLDSLHPALAESYESISECRYLQGRIDEAISSALKGFQIRDADLRRSASFMAERDALTYSEFMRESAGNYLSLFVQQDMLDPRQVEEAINVVIAAKGVVTETVIENRRNQILFPDSIGQPTMEDYRRTVFLLSKLHVGGAGDLSSKAYTERLDSLGRVAKDLEERLALMGHQYQVLRGKEKVTARQIVSVLSDREFLVEYLKYGSDDQNGRPAGERYGLALLGKDMIRFVDLGSARTIDALIEEYRRHINRIEATATVTESDYSEFVSIASAIHARIWRPIAKNVKNASVVFISPDGGLNMVSFGTLIDESGEFLIEEYPVHYLSAGRDMLRFQEERKSGHGFLAVGNPDYDASEDMRISAMHNRGYTDLDETRKGVTTNVRSGCTALASAKLSELPGASEEVRSVAQYWDVAHADEPSVVALGAAASEEMIKRFSPGIRVLHMATHGFFLGAECSDSSLSLDNTYKGENPLLLTGLLLAGAAGARKGTNDSDDGVLTALEVSMVDMTGIDLAVLSACETGLGKVVQAEGVYGLRRAFLIAGVRSVVSSLWKISDVETVRFMRKLYSGTGDSYPRLMQKVAIQQLRELRARKRPPHPYTWGAFMATGDWRREWEGN